MTTPAEFQSYLDAPEGAHFEFKEARGDFQFDQLVRYCVALANEGGGKFILGVTDRRPRSVVGSQAFLEPGRTEAGLFQRLHHRIAVEEYYRDGNRILIVHVPSRPPGSAWSDHGTFWMRAGDSLVGMSDDQLRLIHLETGPDFSSEVCPGATVSDLEPAAIREYRDQWARKSGLPRISNGSDLQILQDAELVVDGGITYAAMVLFGTRAALGRYLGQAEFVFEFRSSEASGPAQDRVEYRQGFFLFHDDLWNRINQRNDRQSYQDGLFRFDIPTFDETVIREAILNAVCHRDYRLGGSVFVRQYHRRLEVVSPGGFPPGITVDNILDQQSPRNRRLAEAFARCGLVERSGQGMNLIFERSIQQSKPLPDLGGSSAHEVRLILHGSVGNPAFIRFLERVGHERLQSFSTYDFLVLDYIAREEPVPDALTANLNRLVSMGVVETVGRGRGARVLLSRALYAHIGRSGTYTRRRGLDRQTNKELLLRHLRDCQESGSPLSELQQVLPQLSERQVQGLLQELHREGRVRLEGVRRWARWWIS